MSANYYDDLGARFGLEEMFLSRLRDMNILYDEDDKGSFFQLYSRAWGGELFFEIVQQDTRDMERPTHPLESPHKDGVWLTVSQW